MKLEKFQIVEVVGVIAVALSLLFVAFELQQANRIARIATNNEVYASFAAINEAVMSDPEFVDLLLRSADTSGNSKLSEVDRARLRSWVRRHLNVWLPATIAHGHGMLTDQTYESIFDDVRNLIEGTGPEMLSIWRQIVDTYPGLASTELFVFMDQLLEEAEQAAI